MDDCLRLCGVSGTKNGSRKQKAGSKSRRTAMYVPDDGVTPVIAVAVLIGMVAVAGFLIGLAMFAALGDASGTLPDVRFQASADGKSLYHAGGDALPLQSLVFYDREMMSISNFTLIKGGSTEAVSPEEQDVWETGDRLQFDELEGLSIVGLDSRGNPALLWQGVNAMVLPVGDMVPDVWITGGNSDIPDSKPKYVLNNPQSWKELVESAKTQNCSGAGKPLPNNTIYYDENDGVLYYYYQSYDDHLESSLADTDVSLQDYFQKKGEYQNMVKIDLSQKVLTYENDTEMRYSNLCWKEAMQKGELFEHENNLILSNIRWRHISDCYTSMVMEAYWVFCAMKCHHFYAMNTKTTPKTLYIVSRSKISPIQSILFQMNTLRPLFPPFNYPE